jgi:ssDNA-specific exonuclease RecJ
MVLYCQAQQSKKHFVVISGRSSQGAFQKKITFENLEELNHFQNILENKEYNRIHFYSAKVNEAHYLVQTVLSRQAPNL